MQRMAIALFSFACYMEQSCVAVLLMAGFFRELHTLLNLLIWKKNLQHGVATKAFLYDQLKQEPLPRNS